jgi:Family of unknown function (DUF6171)
VATLKTSVFNLTQTVIDSLNLYKSKGVFLAESTKQQARISQCVSCPELTDGGMCMKCGCVMNLKVRLEAAKCPMGKW